MNVVDTGADSGTVLHTLTEDREELLVRARVLDGDNISIHVDDRVDNVVEVGIAHMGMDLQVLQKNKFVVKVLEKEITKTQDTESKDFVVVVFLFSISIKEQLQDSGVILLTKGLF